jgi:uncharacterized protein
MMTCSCELEKFKNFFKNCWGDNKPLSKLIGTKNSGYLFDTRTSKLLKCEDNVYLLLEFLLALKPDVAIEQFIETYGFENFINAFEIIKTSIEQKKILSVGDSPNFGLADHFGDFEASLTSKLGILTLEVTEICNLKCGYCIYNPTVKYKRNHGVREMSLDVARLAIDYLKEHSSKSDRVGVAFYGGEPLLRFPFVKDCAEYAGKVIKSKELDFNITTNGTLITSDIAQFLYKNNFSVTVSIDGPREIHDSFRVDANGKGSFENVAKGLKTLVETYGEKAEERILLSMVYTPPFSENRLNRILELWKELPWLPRDIELNITYPSQGSILVRNNNTIIKESKDMNQWGTESFVNSHKQKRSTDSISRSLVEKTLAQFMQRPVFEHGCSRFYLNGCCVPGVRKLFVTVDGSFRVCERIDGDAPTIGDVYKGCDIQKIRDVYIEGYTKISLQDCSNCWAVRICTLCYINAIKSGNWDIETKRENCRNERTSKERLLELFCTLIENDRESLNYLYDLKLH